RRFEDLRRREQLGDSVNALLRGAKGATELMAIFKSIAGVDQHIDAREIALIEEFAGRWHLTPPDLTEGAAKASGDVLAFRKSVANYLQISPPAEQATELLDVLLHFVNADEAVSEEEEIAMDEITAMIMGYVTQSGDHGGHEVVIVPQTDEQVAAVASLLPGIEATSIRGGTVYSVGRFFSSKYADVVCDKYVALGFFTTRIEV
ncbi:MAG: tellurite resistance TerB family protein, partial [Planctomycetota bacterium]